MSTPRRIPELLAPAGSLDAVRAAVANGADSVYLGAEKFNARDDGAQLTLDELRLACGIAHGGGFASTSHSTHSSSRASCPRRWPFWARQLIAGLMPRSFRISVSSG